MDNQIDKSAAGRLGGQVRAARLSGSERSSIAAQGGRARARQRDRNKVMRATHTGNLTLGGTEVECAVLEDERRVISEREFVKTLGRARPGGQTYQRRGGDQLPIYLALKNLKPFIPDDFAVATIPYQAPGRAVAHGVDAAVVPMICEVWLRARDAGSLRASQIPTAVKADIILRGLAQVGIIGLVDEATGYQYDRERQALATILESFVAKELARWAKRFPDEFYRALGKLKGVSCNDSRRPSYFGHLTNDIIYKRLAPGVLDELRRRNPRSERGARRAKHHQWLTPDIGHPKLQEHIWMVIGIMEAAHTYETFIRVLDRVAPRYGDSYSLDLGDARVPA